MNDVDSDRELTRLVERFESHPESRLFAPLADRYRKLGRLDEALDVCREGLNRHPDYSSAYVILGKVHLDRDNPGEAEVAFGRVLELDPGNLLALRNLATLAEGAGRAEEALRYWRALLEVDPLHEEAQLHVESAEASAAAPEGTSEPAPEPDPDEKEDVMPEGTAEGFATRTLADIYYEQGFKAKALTIYERMLVAHPGDALRRKVDRIRDELADIESHLPTEIGDVEELEAERPQALSSRFVDESAAARVSPQSELEDGQEAEDDVEDFTNFKSWLEKNQVKP